MAINLPDAPILLPDLDEPVDIVPELPTLLTVAEAALRYAVDGKLLLSLVENNTIEPKAKSARGELMINELAPDQVNKLKSKYDEAKREKPTRELINKLYGQYAYLENAPALTLYAAQQQFEGMSKRLAEQYGGTKITATHLSRLVKQGILSPQGKHSQGYIINQADIAVIIEIYARLGGVQGLSPFGVVKGRNQDKMLKLKERSQAV